MAKDKKKKKDKKSKAGAGVLPAAVRPKVKKAAKRLKAMSDNPLVADVVAAALVATAAALKDSKKARQLAEQGGDELAKLKSAGEAKGSALWTLALEVGRQALKTLVDEAPAKTKRSGKAK